MTVTFLLLSVCSLCEGTLHIDICPTLNPEGRKADLLVFSGVSMVINPRDNAGNPFGFLSDSFFSKVSSATMVDMLSEFTGWSEVPVFRGSDTSSLWASDPCNSHVDLHVYNPRYQPVTLQLTSLFEGLFRKSAFLGFAAGFNQKPLLEFSNGDVVSWNGTMLLEESEVILFPTRSDTFAGLDLEIDRLNSDNALCHQYSKF